MTDISQMASALLLSQSNNKVADFQKRILFYKGPLSISRLLMSKFVPQHRFLLLVGKLDFVQCPVKVYEDVDYCLCVQWIYAYCSQFIRNIYIQLLPAGGYIDPLDQCFPTRGSQSSLLYLHGHLAMSGNTFDYQYWEVLTTVIGQVEARVVVQDSHPQERMIRSKMSKVSLFRNPALNSELIVPPFVSQCKNRHGFLLDPSAFYPPIIVPVASRLN